MVYRHRSAILDRRQAFGQSRNTQWSRRFRGEVLGGPLRYVGCDPSEIGKMDLGHPRHDTRL